MSSPREATDPPEPAAALTPERRILFERTPPIATITLHRPQSLNAMSSEMYREITDALRAVDEDPEIRVAIVTGSGGRAFSAGADLKEMHQEAGADGQWAPWRPRRWDLGLAVAKPLIAAIDGYAVAGGLELALFCDIRIATPQSQFGCPETKWNLIHGFGALRLPRIVGLSNAMLLLLTGDFIDANEALRIGLISRIVEPPALMAEAHRLANSIAEKASNAVQMTKELALRGLEGTLEQNLRLYQEYMTRLEGSEEQLQRTAGFGSNRGDAEDR
jgi:enoyl-CoA hydratase/carnithine racemase